MSIFRNSIQSGIASLDQGMGKAILRVLLFVMLGVGIYTSYAWSQFRGLKDPIAMEYAQLARNLATDRGYVTQCVRPIDLRRLERSGGAAPPASEYPDMRNAPAWPAMLATGFKLLRPSFEPPSRSGIFEPERKVIVPLGIMLSLATGLLVLLLGSALFDYRTGVVAMSMVFLNGALLKASISGSCIPATTLLVTAAFCAAVFGIRLGKQGRPWPLWMSCVILCGLLCAAAFLTAYSAIVILPVLMLCFRFGFDEKRWLVIPVCLLVFALSITPWLLRNHTVTGGILGMAPYAAIQESLLFPEDSFDRSLNPATHNVRMANAMKAKFKTNARQILEEGFGLTGAGIMAAFFIVSLFHRFEEEESERWKWHILFGVVVAAALLSIRGISAISLTCIFFPLIILFGTGFFFVMASRLSTYRVEFETTLSVLIIAFAAAPFLLGLAGQRAPIPYPPYYPPLNAYAAQSIGPDEMICTDVPQATAWYGNRTSLLLPNTVDEFIAIKSTGLPCKALYLTSKTAAQRTGRSTAGEEVSWSMILDRRVPEAFPLHHGVDLPPGTRDQLLLLDNHAQPDALPDGD